MANLKTVLLSKSEENLIHDQSIKCLKEVGVRIDSGSVLDLLEKKGAFVDHANNIARTAKFYLSHLLLLTLQFLISFRIANPYRPLLKKYQNKSHFPVIIILTNTSP